MTRDEAVQLLESKGYQVPDDVKSSSKPLCVYWRITGNKLGRLDEHGVIRNKSGVFIPNSNPDEGWQKPMKLLQRIFLQYTGGACED